MLAATGLTDQGGFGKGAPAGIFYMSGGLIADGHRDRSCVICLASIAP
jgi:hypothetical protein